MLSWRSSGLTPLCLHRDQNMSRDKKLRSQTKPTLKMVCKPPGSASNPPKNRLIKHPARWLCQQSFSTLVFSECIYLAIYVEHYFFSSYQAYMNMMKDKRKHLCPQFFFCFVGMRNVTITVIHFLVKRNWNFLKEDLWRLQICWCPSASELPS